MLENRGVFNQLAVTNHPYNLCARPQGMHAEGRDGRHAAVNHDVVLRGAVKRRCLLANDAPLGAASALVGSSAVVLRTAAVLSPVQDWLDCGYSNSHARR